MTTTEITSTHLFAGAGGDSEGFAQAGVRVEAAANHNPLAIATHELNHPDAEHNGENLLDVDWRTFPSSTILWGSPSCVWHARAGGRKAPPVELERLRADAGAVDRATAFAIIAAAEVHKYPVIFVENVPEFRDWSLYGWWLDGLRALGYTVQETILNAANFDHAQQRYRYFAAATRDGLELDLTVPDLAPVYADSIIDDTPLKPVTRPMYVTPQLEQITERETPYLLTYRRNASAKRADQHQIATVTAGGGHHAIGMIDDQGKAWHRMMNNRELARAQGFPDGYRFLGNDREVKRMIGNAVPVGVARFLASRAMEALAA